MKRNLLIISIFSIISLASCADKNKEGSAETQIEVTIENEKELANEAAAESNAAKKEAQETENAVDQLLEDI